LLHKTLNLGILAHVDAGKTTLTERLLYAGGVIEEIGSVDQGTTQTDFLALERQRGITIRSAVASFAIGDVTVNQIDTPGHPDFIAEVERVLSVLDGAVLVISAVEGVQPQTRILMRALQRLRIPTLIFVNKIDRPGAGDDRVLNAISDRLSAAIIPLGSVQAIGTRTASFVLSHDRLPELLAERDDEILASYVEDESTVPSRRLREALAAQTQRAAVHPVFFGSAITGAGVEQLMSAIGELLPASQGDPDGPVAGTVFKIERGPTGEKVAYVRMFSGTIHTRDRLHFGRELDGKVTAIAVFERGPAVRRQSVGAGQVGKLWGLGEIQIGARIGEAGEGGTAHQFPPPTLESTVIAPNGDGARLRVALGQLAEQDPLINVRQDDTGHEISVSLYGEVQKEVIQATLANEFDLDVTFRETTLIHIERPTRNGEAIELLHADSNPFLATIGLRVSPAPIDAGIDVRLEIDPRSAPLYIYKTLESFTQHMDEYVREALREGVFGWQVTDCTVTMTKCIYSVPDGPPSRRGPLSAAADFRKLTPLVLRQALERARPVVCEPIVRISVEVPTGAIGPVLAALGRLGAAVETPTLRSNLSVLEAVMPAALAQDLQRQLPGLTGGEGVLDSTFAGYQPVSGATPTRRQRPTATGAVPETVGRPPSP
jgi:ribosomal protection tetracycline resistance protein